jgi:hypothetical protein
MSSLDWLLGLWASYATATSALYARELVRKDKERWDELVASLTAASREGRKPMAISFAQLQTVFQAFETLNFSKIGNDVANAVKDPGGIIADAETVGGVIVSTATVFDAPVGAMLGTGLAVGSALLNAAEAFLPAAESILGKSTAPLTAQSIIADAQTAAGIATALTGNQNAPLGAPGATGIV